MKGQGLINEKARDENSVIDVPKGFCLIPVTDVFKEMGVLREKHGEGDSKNMHWFQELDKTQDVGRCMTRQPQFKSLTSFVLEHSEFLGINDLIGSGGQTSKTAEVNQTKAKKNQRTIRLGSRVPSPSVQQRCWPD